MSFAEHEVAWRVGGPQGSGVDTAATIFARACAAGGHHVLGRREYYSNIMGRHSYFDIRVAEHELLCHTDEVELLTTFDAETLARHAIPVVEGGAIVHAAADADEEIAGLQFLDRRGKEDLIAHLEEKDLPATTGGLLEDARGRGVRTYEVPFGDLTGRLAEERDIAQALADRTTNTMAVAVSFALLGYDPDCIRTALERTFASKESVVDLNVRAVEMVYEYVEEHPEAGEFGRSLAPLDERPERLYVNGNQAVAMGKIAAGMSFQTYYPISPATDESVYLEGHATFPTRDGTGEASVTIVQTEDEIAAVTMASGAALTGARSATATSGPGFSLMVEGLGWAGINEVPLVITLYQRGSPSTGMPTRSEQGDLNFAIHGGHGEVPRMVIASGDVEEAFADAGRAFNYAETYQLPVLHVLDKALASTTRTTDPFAVDEVTIERGEIAEPDPDAEGTFERFADTESGVSPRPLPGTPGGEHWLTGGEHTKLGRVTEDPVVRERMMEKRARKLETALEEIPDEEKLLVHGPPDARLTVVTWGSNKMGLLEAIDRLAARDIDARVVQLRLLWPFPADLLEAELESADPLVACEANFSGQMAGLIRRETGREVDHLVTKYNGRPMAGRKLAEVLEEVHGDSADPRIVIRNPHE